MDSVNKPVAATSARCGPQPAVSISEHMQLTSAMRRLEAMWSKEPSERVSLVSSQECSSCASLASESTDSEVYNIVHIEPPLKYAVNPNVGQKAWSLATISLIAKDAVVGVADLTKCAKWASRRVLKYFSDQTKAENFFTYAPRCFKGSAVAEGLKNAMMVPVETYIEDDATFVADTVNSENFLLFVSALFKDEDMARMLQNAPPVRPDVKVELDAYYSARNALEKKYGDGDLYKKELKELSYPSITFEDEKANETFELIASRLSRPEFQPMFEKLHERCSNKFQTGKFAEGA